ncbi:MAG: FHA domain-containing protein [Pseudonocardia sp.]
MVGRDPDEFGEARAQASLTQQPNMTDVERHPAVHSGLAHRVMPTARGTLVAQAIGGGITIGPREGRTILFGRNAEEVHICVGADDRRVSRQHGVLTCRDDRWWVRNTGRSPIRLPARLLFTNEEPVPLAEGYTPLFVRGSNGREHLLEMYVVGPGGDRPHARHDDATHTPKIWALSDEEQIALIVLGQRYLLHEMSPQPLPWRQAADQLAELQPDAGWTIKRLEHMVVKVRARLSRGGVAGLTREEVPEPVGNLLNHNLIRALVLSGTLVPPDLTRLDAGGDGIPRPPAELS